jgi:hypothetical protein
MEREWLAAEMGVTHRTGLILVPERSLKRQNR